MHNMPEPHADEVMPTDTHEGRDLYALDHADPRYRAAIFNERRKLDAFARAAAIVNLAAAKGLVDVFEAADIVHALSNVDKRKL